MTKLKTLLLLALLCCPVSLLAVGLNGTIQGTPTFGTAKFSQGLTAVSGSNYISVPAGTFPSGNATQTYEAWVKTTNSGTQVFLGNGSLWLGSANGYFAYSGIYSFSVTQTTGLIDDGNWHHVAITTGATTTAWVDGVSVGTTSGSYSGVSPSGTSGNIGNLSGSYAWSGSIDEVAIFNYDKYTATFTPPTAPYVGNESNLNALYHLDGNATDSSGAAASLIAMNSGAILYSPYNWNVTSSGASTINSGAYFRTIFSGTSFGLAASTTANTSPYSEFWVRIDNQAWVQYTLPATSGTISMATALANRKHLAEVVIKSTSETIARWSSSATMVTFTGVSLDTGATLTLPARRTKNILIYGDSITEGVRTINNTATNDTDRNDVLGDYSYALSTAVDAEVGIVAFGATGISVSGSGSVPALPSSYNYLYSGVARSFSPAPDLVIYNEGTNDGSTNIVSAFEGVINGILSAAPNSKHLLLVPFNGNQAANIAAVVTELANGRVSYASTTGWFNTADSSDGLHPYNYEHIGYIAPKLFPLVEQLLYPGGKSYTFF